MESNQGDNYLQLSVKTTKTGLVFIWYLDFPNHKPSISNKSKDQ